MERRAAWSCGLLAALLVAASPATGQVLTNSTFDATVSGWGALTNVTLEWDELDAAASLASGSALVAYAGPSAANSSGAYQCRGPIRSGGTYDVEAKILVPSGQTETGFARILVQWFASEDCLNQLNFDVSPPIASSIQDQWVDSSARIVAPVDAVFVRVTLSLYKAEAGGSLRAHFDDVHLTSTVIFEDGFDNGTTDAWTLPPL